MDVAVTAEATPEAELIAPATGQPTPPVEPAPAPLLSVLEPDPAPFDLLGPNFMGDRDPPPVVRKGSNMFEFEDMADDDTGADLGVAARG
jgi:hypothetical protein